MQNLIFLCWLFMVPTCLAVLFHLVNEHGLDHWPIIKLLEILSLKGFCEKSKQTTILFQNTRQKYSCCNRSIYVMSQVTCYTRLLLLLPPTLCYSIASVLFMHYWYCRFIISCIRVGGRKRVREGHIIMLFLCKCVCLFS